MSANQEISLAELMETIIRRTKAVEEHYEDKSIYALMTITGSANLVLKLQKYIEKQDNPMEH